MRDWRNLTHPSPSSYHMAPRPTTETSDAKEGSQNATQSLLDIIINNELNLTERKVRPLAQQLARTLSLVHAHGVVHRSAYAYSIALHPAFS